MPPIAISPAKPRRTFLRSVAAIVWERRWKLAATFAAYALARSCEYAPDWAQPVCEVLAQLARVLP